MERFVIHGGHELFGEINISGAKNAAVAILPAALLAEDIVRIENIPKISDTRQVIKVLKKLGAKVDIIDGNTIEIDSKNIEFQEVPEEITSTFRASYYLLGVMLGRFKKARVAMPGGCNFGERPIDLHIKGFRTLGSDIYYEVAHSDGNVIIYDDEEVKKEGHVLICAEANKLIGHDIYLDFPSVGATINIMLAAVLARGKTVIDNAAKEPHIVDLANFLNSMGADIKGAGTDIIKITGVTKLHGCTYSMIPDQIEAGTYMVAAAACGGDVLIKNVIPKHLESITAKIEEAGADVIEYDDAVRVTRFKNLTKCNVTTKVYPGFPTDMQPQMAILLSVAEGTSILTESVWEHRFQYIAEFMKMNPNIKINGKKAIIDGVKKLSGAHVKATDLRAGAAMVIAGMVAEGETVVENVQFIDRGYEEIVEKLSSIGADIVRETVE